MFAFARNLVRMAAENEKPNSERLIEFTDARRASLELAQAVAEALKANGGRRQQLEASLARLQAERQ